MINPYTGKGRTAQLLFGNHTGKVLSRVQGTIVSAGTLLQSTIQQLCKDHKHISFQEKFLDPTTSKKFTADIVIMDGSPEAIELKLGYEFDTKKAKKEVEDIKTFAHLLSIKKNIHIKPSIALFNALGINEIKVNFKHQDSEVQFYDGQSLCLRLNIPWNEVFRTLSQHQYENRQELINILLPAINQDNLEILELLEIK